MAEKHHIQLIDRATREVAFVISEPHAVFEVGLLVLGSTALLRGYGLEFNCLATVDLDDEFAMPLTVGYQNGSLQTSVNTDEAPYFITVSGQPIGVDPTATPHPSFKEMMSQTLYILNHHLNQGFNPGTPSECEWVETKVANHIIEKYINRRFIDGRVTLDASLGSFSKRGFEILIVDELLDIDPHRAILQKVDPPYGSHQYYYAVRNDITTQIIKHLKESGFDCEDRYMGSSRSVNCAIDVTWTGGGHPQKVPKMTNRSFLSKGGA